MTDEELKGALPDIPSALEIITTLSAQLAEAQRLMRLERTIADKNADKAERAEAALAAQIEVDAGIADGFSDCQYRAIEMCVEAIRNQPHDRTALDRLLTEAREKALREVLEKAKASFYGVITQDAILALIEKPNAS